MVVQKIRTKRKARRNNNRSRRNNRTNKKNRTQQRTNRKNRKNRRVKRTKRTLKKGKISKRSLKKELQTGGTIDKITSNLQFMLAMDKIEFLPSTNILEKNYKHYFKMVDYITLQEIVNNNPELKKSPTIQQLFDIKKYNLNDKGMIFDYKNIKCDNLLEKDQRNYTLRLLFLYLLECNLLKYNETVPEEKIADDVEEDEIELFGGAEDKEPKPSPDSPVEEPVPEEPGADAAPAPEEPEPGAAPVPEEPSASPEEPGADAAPVPEEPGASPEEPEPDAAPVPDGPEPDAAPVPDEPEPEAVPEEPEAVPEEPEPDAEEPEPDAAPFPEEPEPVPEEPEPDAAPFPKEPEPDATPEEPEPDATPEEPEPGAVEVQDEFAPEPDPDPDPGPEELEVDFDDADVDAGPEEDDVEKEYPDLLMDMKEEKEEEGEDEDEDGVTEKMIDGEENEAEKEKYREKREELELKINEIVDVNRLQVTRNELVLHNVDWFNVCCGISEYDLLFEEKCRKEIDSMGITIKRSDIMKTMDTIINNENHTTALRRAIKARLLQCSSDPQTFFDRIMNNVTYPSYSSCDHRVPGSVLYLYDEYLYLLNMKIDGVTKLEMVLLLIFCETRQHLLSKYISLENLRKKKDSIGDVKKLMKNLLKLDKGIIEKYKMEEEKKQEQEQGEKEIVDAERPGEGPVEEPVEEEREELNEMERMEYQKLMELKKEKEEEEQQKREQMPEIQRILQEDNEIKERIKLELENMEPSPEVKDAKEGMDGDGFDMFALDKDEQVAVESRMSQEGGDFKFNKNKIKEECNTIKENRLIFPHQLRSVYNCFDN